MGAIILLLVRRLFFFCRRAADCLILCYNAEAGAGLCLSACMFIKFLLAELLNASQRPIPVSVQICKVAHRVNVDSSVCTPHSADCAVEVSPGQVLTVGNQHVLKNPNLFAVEIPLVIFNVIGDTKRLIFLCPIFKFLGWDFSNAAEVFSKRVL